MKSKAQKLAKALHNISLEKDSSLVDSFFKYCQQKNLEYLLPNILKYYQEILKQEELNRTIKIKSAFPIDKKTVEKIKEIVSADKGASEGMEILPELIGGFVVEYQNKVFDASLKNQLNQLKNKLINN